MTENKYEIIHNFLLNILLNTPLQEPTQVWILRLIQQNKKDKEDAEEAIKQAEEAIKQKERIDNFLKELPNRDIRILDFKFYTTIKRLYKANILNIGQLLELSEKELFVKLERKKTSLNDVLEAINKLNKKYNFTINLKEAQND